MKELKTFRGANFIGTLGEKFRFCTLDDNSRPSGVLLIGEVKKIYLRGRKTVVDLYLPTLGCTCTYSAERLYFRGSARKTNY